MLFLLRNSRNKQIVFEIKIYTMCGPFMLTVIKTIVWKSNQHFCAHLNSGWC